MKRFSTLFAVALLLVIFSQANNAQGPRKPPLPKPPASETGIVQAVVAATNGAQFTPLYVSASVQADLAAFDAPFQGISLDFTSAVHYITTTGNLLETLIPVEDIGDEPLAPDIVAPRKKPKPGKPGKPKQDKPGMVIGAWFQPELGARWIVVTFKKNGDADKVRFYLNNGKYSEVPLIKGKFKDHYGDGVIEQVDKGAVIADKRSCITVGLDQVCWGPVDHKLVRDETKPSKRVKKIEKKFSKLYNIGVDFDEKNALPDILGKSQREACATYLSSATSFSAMSCKANAIFAVAKKGGGKNDPIALLLLSSEANIRTFNAAGQHLGDTLPAGSYVVLPTPVDTSTAGTPTALFLVDLNGNTYLIPSTVMQGFGKGAIGDTGQAGIRDGFARYRLFGW